MKPGYDPRMDKLGKLKKRSMELLHGMQSAIEFGFGGSDGNRQHKHLRVGINNALISHAALVQLLIEKGVITEEEYFDKYVEALELELMGYESEAASKGMPNVRFR